MRLKPSKGFIQKAGKTLQKASPTILSCFGAVGVVVTAALAVKATPKALDRIEDAKSVKMAENGENLTRLETIGACWMTYTPSALAGIATIGCIFGANYLNRRQQASLISAYAFLDRSFREYKQSVKNVFGEEGHQRVLEDIAYQRVSSDHTIYSVGPFRTTTLDFNVPEEEHLFYDAHSDRQFTSTIGKVLQAEYYLNKTFAQNSSVTLNEFYNFLGIDPVDGGDDVGWWVDPENEYYWVEFNHTLTYLDDGVERPQVECLVIEFPDPPVAPPPEW